MDQKFVQGEVGIIRFGDGFRVVAGTDVLGTFSTLLEAVRFKKAWFQQIFHELEAEGKIVKGADGRYRARRDRKVIEDEINKIT
jgi:hypothetical protein